MTSLDSSQLKLWEFVSEAGFIAVILGVAMEVVELLTKWFERCRKRRLPLKFRRWLLPIETTGFVILVIGLAVEFLGSHNAMRISDRENARLNKLAEDSRLKADELEAKLRPRTITQSQHEKFVRILTSASHKPVWIICSRFWGDTGDFVSEIRGMLDDAGYGIDPQTPIVARIPPLNFKGGFVISHDTVPKPGVFVESSLQSETLFKDSTSEIGIVINQSDWSNNIPTQSLELAKGFKQIGIAPTVISSDDIRQGETVIIIPNKRGF